VSAIEDLMATCPLKQHIREVFWLPYITKLAKKPIKYLTLYCPPLMDVKHFYKKNYIKLEDGVYSGVVGVTNDPEEGYSKTISGAAGRPELLKIGFIHDLMQKKEKDLLEKFPFDAINLDYCDQLFGKLNKEDISRNLNDITRIIEHQSKGNSNKFVLFVTTRADISNAGGGFAPNFLDNLSDRIEANIKINPTFNRKYKQLFNNHLPKEIATTNYQSFIATGIIKLISMELAVQGYTIKDCDVFWLTRNQNPPQRDLLHIALFISEGSNDDLIKFRENRLRHIGSFIFLEMGATLILDKIIGGQIKSINEIEHRKSLEMEYGKYLESLNKENFELPVPEPIKNE
jgi:hypothetical protein